MNTARPDDQQEAGPETDVPLGLRLRRAREAMGLSVADVAERLRLKSATVEALEREDLDALGAAVYVRGYFSSYSRMVGLPLVLVDGAVSRRVELTPAPLSSTARTSHSRFLFDRFAKRAVYVVLTASIVVPVILLATRDQLPRPGATLTPLDTATRVELDSKAFEAPPGSEPVTPSPADLPDQESPSGKGARSPAENPVIASLTPFYQPVREPLPPLAAPAAPVAEVTGLSLHFLGDSWVEVIGRNGERLEYGLIRAGTVRGFDEGEVGRVSLGNASAVEVRMNGVVTDIAAFRRANVARFTVSSQGTLASAGG